MQKLELRRNKRHQSSVEVIHLCDVEKAKGVICRENRVDHAIFSNGFRF